MNPLETLMVGHEKDVRPEVFSDFVAECRTLGVEPVVESREGGAVMALEDYIPPALIVFLAKPFFDAFLKKAGEDSYAAFKKVLAALIKKACAIRVLVFASAPGKIDPQYPFSRYVAIYSRSPEGAALKFLFIAEGDDAYVNASTSALCDMLRTGSFPRADHRPVAGIYVLYFDRETKAWTYKKDGLTSRHSATRAAVRHR